MAFTPIPNGIRIVHLGHVGIVPVVNTIGAVNGDQVAGSDLNDLAKHHGDAWRARILPVLSGQYQHDATLAYSLEDQSKAAGDAGFAAAQAGARPGGPMPLNTCMVVAFKTAKRGRTYEGRTFLSCIPGDSSAGDGFQWAAGSVAAVQAAFNSYKADVDPAIGHNGRMAVCSKGSVLHGISPHVEAVTSIIVRPKIGTQRRRLVG